MLRSRRWSALASLIAPIVLLTAVCGETPADKEKRSGDKPEEKWLVDRALTVSAAPVPVPAFKYRLYPRTSERVEGNAIPIYLRFAHERNDATKKMLRDKPLEWNKLPLDKLPVGEVKKFLDGYSYNLRQLDLGARRKTADWNYTLDAGNPIGLLMPDVQEMRMHAPVLILKARVEAAEGRYAEALHTLETELSFSQQINEGPFLINSLVGVACASLGADCLLDLIERPDAPNVYWALNVLPRPFIDLRRAYEFEQSLLEAQFPELADLNRPRSAEEWDAVLRRIRRDIESATKGDPNAKPPKPGNGVNDLASKSPDLPEARRYLGEVAGIAAAKIEAMPPGEILLRYLVQYHHELRDEAFKSAYLPFYQTQAVFAEAEKRLKMAPDTEAARLVLMFLPSIRKVQLSQVRLERKFAALRVIETLRMHAAANGQLPEKLDQVTIVPVPNDPGTAKPFEYQRDGASATLISRIPGESQEVTGMRYRITLRK
jgi:hypothetical protein